MRIKFWGVRGSLASPLTNEQVQAKLTAAISRMTPRDLESSESKMKFISNLPEWIYGTVGGNTPCVELRTKNDDLFLLDCGTGLRAYAVYGRHPENHVYNIFLSHFHWDHIQGFPFFGPSFNPASQIHIYTPFEKAEEYFAAQSSTPFFPPNACWNNVKKQITFHIIKEDEPLYVAGLKINCRKMVHPGDSYSYSFEEDNKKFIYATDIELQPQDFEKTNVRNKFFDNTDVLILDSQYTNPEAIQKVNWGHNSFSSAIDFATMRKVKNLYFFHHEPNYDDKKLDTILSAGKQYLRYNSDHEINLFLSKEGQEVEI